MHIIFQIHMHIAYLYIPIYIYTYTHANNRVMMQAFKREDFREEWDQ